MQFDRRDFLKASAAITAASWLTPTSARADKNDVIRVGVVGLHGRGQSHLAGFETSQSDVVAICDVDSDVLNQSGGRLDALTGRKNKRFVDVRELIADPNIDAISIATPNHWHSLMGIWAMQAGKDVYVEKPCSHNIVEGRRLVDVARKRERICQHGTQSRSGGGVQEAMKFLHEGGIGKVHTAKGLCYKWRPSIGKSPDSATPANLDWNLWLGPAANRSFSKRYVHYNWHWAWDFGNGDIGNQGVHQMDVARWGLNKKEFPISAMSSGGRFGYEDDGQTPNTQVAILDYGDCQLQFEVRGLPTNDERGVRVGNIFYGSEGYLVLAGDKWETFMGKNNEPGKKGTSGREESHFANFLRAVRSRKIEDLNADVEEGHQSAALGHLANVAFRLGRKVTIDPKNEDFGSDEEANRYLTREYRSPFELPPA